MKVNMKEGNLYGKADCYIGRKLVTEIDFNNAKRPFYGEGKAL